MDESLFTKIHEAANYLKLDIELPEVATLAVDNCLSEEGIRAVSVFVDYLKEKKRETIINTQLRLSRLPLKEPKTFDNFDFSLIHGKQLDALKNLPDLAELYAHKNLAIIGPQGVGKTHLAMAFGRECCLKV